MGIALERCKTAHCASFGCEGFGLVVGAGHLGSDRM